MRFQFIKKLIAATVAGAVITASVLPMSALAYSETYIGAKTINKTAKMGYKTENQLVAYTYEIYAKTSVKSGPPVSTFVQTWGSTLSANNKPNTFLLEESLGSSGVYAQTVRSSITFIGGVSFHYVSSPEDTFTEIDIGSNKLVSFN